MADPFDVGQAVWVEGRFRVDGALVDPSTVQLTWKIPAGATTVYNTGQLDHPSTGLYRKQFTLGSPGLYIADWLSTGVGAASTEQVYAVAPSQIDGFLLAYYGSDPTAVPRDQVRLLVGDTEAGAFFLLDKEYDWLLTRAKGDITTAAATAATAIAARFSREVDRSLGDVSRSASQRALAYRELASALAAQAHLDRVLARSSAAPIPRSGKPSPDDGGYFSMGMFEPPYTSRPQGGPGNRRAGW